MTSGGFGAGSLTVLPASREARHAGCPMACRHVGLSSIDRQLNPDMIGIWSPIPALHLAAARASVRVARPQVVL